MFQVLGYMLKEKMVSIQDSIRHLLLFEWDPIGIQNELGAQDEYDSYVNGIYRLVVGKNEEEKILDHLYLLHTEVIGLETTREELMPVVKKLAALKENQ